MLSLLIISKQTFLYLLILGFFSSTRHLFGVDAPGRIHIWGADSRGRDLFSRIDEIEIPNINVISIFQIFMKDTMILKYI